MTKVYIIKNQHDLYLSKQHEWVEPSESSSFYRTEHKDEAINVKVELAVRAPELRLELIQCAVNDRGVPQLLISNEPQLTQEPQPPKEPQHPNEPLPSSIDKTDKAQAPTHELPEDQEANTPDNSTAL